MERFAGLIDRLVYTPSRNRKLDALAEYFRAAPDPDRGYALAALTGELNLPAVKSAAIRAASSSRPLVCTRPAWSALPTCASRSGCCSRIPVSTRLRCWWAEDARSPVIDGGTIPTV